MKSVRNVPNNPGIPVPDINRGDNGGTDGRDLRETNESSPVSFADKFCAIASSVGRTTVRTIKGIPHRISDKVKRIITDRRRRPERKEMNRVYVLVGYTSKKSIDKRYNAERSLIALRRSLLVVILILILVRMFNTLKPLIQLDEYGEMFGISSAEELTQNDPYNPGYTVPTDG